MIARLVIRVPENRVYRADEPKPAAAEHHRDGRADRAGPGPFFPAHTIGGGLLHGIGVGVHVVLLVRLGLARGFVRTVVVEHGVVAGRKTGEEL